MCRRPTVLIVLAALYGATCVGGWVSHAKELDDRAERLWRALHQADTELAATAAKLGGPVPRANARRNGPCAGVDWCFPLLPGVLIADSYYVTGRLSGEGGVKIIVYWRLGSRELTTLWGWIS
ncbi:MAG: hypothetical protein JXO22_07680 [Phycisphaerae bacterium]|nr:hypothetical protein [Phycisphaerae bacterium]